MACIVSLYFFPNESGFLLLTKEVVCLLFLERPWHTLFSRSSLIGRDGKKSQSMTSWVTSKQLCVHTESWSEGHREPSTPLYSASSEDSHRLRACVGTHSSPALCDPMDCSHQAPLSMVFSRQEYWSGLPFPTPGDLPDPGLDQTCISWVPALAGKFFTFLPPGKPSCRLDSVVIWTGHWKGLELSSQHQSSPQSRWKLLRSPSEATKRASYYNTFVLARLSASGQERRWWYLLSPSYYTRCFHMTLIKSPCSPGKQWFFLLIL